MFLSYFRTKLRKEIICFTKILCFIHFLCMGIDLVPQKTLIPKVILLTVRKNPGLQPDTASYLQNSLLFHFMSFSKKVLSWWPLESRISSHCHSAIYIPTNSVCEEGNIMKRFATVFEKMEVHGTTMVEPALLLTSACIYLLDVCFLYPNKVDLFSIFVGCRLSMIHNRLNWSTNPHWVHEINL